MVNMKLHVQDMAVKDKIPASVHTGFISVAYSCLHFFQTIVYIDLVSRR